MFLRFRFSNFRSFREEQELSLIASHTLTEPNAAVVPVVGENEFVLLSAAIYGANASGKTNVLRALKFFSNALAQSYREWTPDGPIAIEPFVIPNGKSHGGSRFQADFLVEGVRFCYGFRLDARVVWEEWLFAYPKGKKQTWFHRQFDTPISFSAKMAGANRLIEGITRSNSLFLSVAAQNNHAALRPIFKWLGRIDFVGKAVDHHFPRRLETAEELHKDRGFAASVGRMLQSADLGIVAVDVEKSELTTSEKASVSAGRWPRKEEPLIDDMKIDLIRFVHRFGDITSRFSEAAESAGTLAYFDLLRPVFKALNSGGVLCVDELDARFHPLLASQLIRLFNDRASNPHAAQLIFNTHDTALLSQAKLRRDQIWFTEKSAEGASHLYPLTDFKPRQNENLESGYLQGRYGAIPFLDPLLLTPPEPQNGKTRKSRT